MSYGYGGRENPYDQRGGQGGYGAPSGRPQQGGYDSYSGAQGYGPAHSDNSYGGANVELEPLTHNASGMAGSGGNAILNECRDIDQGIGQIDRNLQQLRMLQKRTIDDADSSPSSVANRQLDSLSSETMALYRTLTDRVRTVKSNPDSRSPKNSPQVGRVDRRLKEAIQQYQKVELDFRKGTKEKMARQYLIVRPDASEQEVRAAVEDANGGQIFSQALMQSGRQGAASVALRAVQDRHKALVKIEEQMKELSQLFLDIDTLVVQQEAAIIDIEQKGEEVVDNLDKGNEEIGVAVTTARKTRKKKWICLGICVVIIAIVVIVVLIYIFVIRGQNNGNKNNKRLIADLGNLPIINGLPLHSFREGPRIEARDSPAGEAAKQIIGLAGGRIHMPQMTQ